MRYMVTDPSKFKLFELFNVHTNTDKHIPFRHYFKMLYSHTFKNDVTGMKVPTLIQILHTRPHDYKKINVLPVFISRRAAASPSVRPTDCVGGVMG